jgi:hypothetical protein
MFPWSVPCWHFDVEFGQDTVLDDGHPVLFGMGGVDQHFLVM